MANLQTHRENSNDSKLTQKRSNYLLIMEDRGSEPEQSKLAQLHCYHDQDPAVYH